MIQLNASEYVPQLVSSQLFGANILATRDKLDGSTKFRELFSKVNATGIRYPGGSLTEKYFDLKNPDQSTVVDANGKHIDFIPISSAIELASEFDVPISIVVPTRDFLGTRVDANGDRYPKFEEDTLRSFVDDVVTGKYGYAEVSAFEIGNEYWGSGEMSAVEYGRIASQFARIIDQELKQTLPPQDADKIDIVVQVGTNFNFSSIDENYSDVQDTSKILLELSKDYAINFKPEEFLFSSGKVNWTRVNNELIIREFDTSLEQDAIDGVAVHLYSKEPFLPGTRNFFLDETDATWEKHFPGVETHVTEWNQSRSPALTDSDEDFGLFQAQEILQTVEAFVASGVDVAQVWPLLQNTDNALARGFEFTELTPAGQMFSWLSESLPGKVNLDFTPRNDETTEFITPDASVHAFYGDGEITLFVASKAEETVVNFIDISQMASKLTTFQAEVLTVENPEEPGSNNSIAIVDILEDDEVYEDGIFEAILDPGEIMRITIPEFVPTSDFRIIMKSFENFVETGEYDLEDIVPLEDELATEEPEEEPDESGITDSLFILLGLLPLLALAGLG